MTRRQLEQIRPWAEPVDGVTMPADVGYKPPILLVTNGYLRHVVDNFYELTEKGAREIEALRVGGPR